MTTVVVVVEINHRLLLQYSFILNRRTRVDVIRAIEISAAQSESQSNQSNQAREANETLKLPNARLRARPSPARSRPHDDVPFSPLVVVVVPAVVPVPVVVPVAPDDVFPTFAFPNDGIPFVLNPACVITPSTNALARRATNASVVIAAEHVARNPATKRVELHDCFPNAYSVVFTPRLYRRFTPNARIASNTASFFAIHSLNNSAGAATGIARATTDGRRQFDLNSRMPVPFRSVPFRSVPFRVDRSFVRRASSSLVVVDRDSIAISIAFRLRRCRRSRSRATASKQDESTTVWRRLTSSSRRRTSDVDARIAQRERVRVSHGRRHAWMRMNE